MLILTVNKKHTFFEKSEDIQITYQTHLSLFMAMQHLDQYAKRVDNAPNPWGQGKTEFTLLRHSEVEHDAGYRLVEDLYI